ncbi:MAG: hypothetical protein ACTSXP_08160 [Promethearchaeota archaeon]
MNYKIKQKDIGSRKRLKLAEKTIGLSIVAVMCVSLISSFILMQNNPPIYKIEAPYYLNEPRNMKWEHTSMTTNELPTIQNIWMTWQSWSTEC